MPARFILLFLLLWANYMPAQEDTATAYKYKLQGIDYQQRGFYEEALKSYKAAHLAYEWQSPPSQEMQLAMAAMYSEQMRWDSASLITRFYLDLGDKLPPNIQAKASKTMGDILRAKGDYENALPYYQTAQALYNRGESANSAAVYLGMGECYAKLRETTQAFLYYKKAESAFLQYAELDDVLFVQLYERFADVYKSNNDLYNAERWYQKALKLLRAFYTDQHPEAISIYYNLGLCSPDANKSRDYLELSLALSQNYKKSRLTGQIHLQLGQYYHTAGNKEKAEQHYIAAKKNYEEQYQDEHPDMGQVYRFWADLYAADAPEKALTMLNQAIFAACPSVTAPASSFDVLPTELNENYAWGIDYHCVIRCIIEKNKIFYNQYTKDKELKLLRRIAEHSQVARGMIQRLLSRPAFNAEVYADWMSEIYSQAIDALGILYQNEKKAEHIQNSFIYSDEHKAIETKQTLQIPRNLPFGELPDSLQQLEYSLMRNQENANYEWQTARQASWAGYQEAAYANYNKAQSEYKSLAAGLQKDYPRYHLLRYGFKESQPADIQALLSDEKLLLEYYITHQNVHVYALSKQGLTLRVLPISDSLNRMLNNYHEELTDTKAGLSPDAYRRYTQAAHFLYRQFLHPELAKAPNCKQLVIVGSQKLGQIPFEALLCSPAAAAVDYSQLDYLLRHYTVKYSYSAALLLANRQKPKLTDSHTILAAAPDYDSSSLALVPDEALFLERQKLQPLRSAPYEITLLNRAFYGRFLKGIAATETAFKASELDHYAVIHLAMHLKNNSESPIESGLFFTEDGDTLEDDVLHGYEISRCSIPAHLLILASCGMGNGQWVPTEGVQSIAQAFMYAGTSGVLSSLWEIEDESTSDLLNYFYEELRPRTSKSQALQIAKLNYINYNGNTEKSHPFYWASYVFMGDDSPIRLYRQETQGNEVLWGAAICVGIMSWFLFRAMKRTSKRF